MDALFSPEQTQAILAAYNREQENKIRHPAQGLQEIDLREAKRILSDCRHDKRRVYADPKGLVELKVSKNVDLLCHKDCEQILALEPYYTAYPDNTTRNYLSPGKWDAENNCKLSLTESFKVNPPCKIEPNEFDAFKRLASKGIRFANLSEQFGKVVGPCAVLSAHKDNSVVEAALAAEAAEYGYNLKSFPESKIKSARKVVFGKYTIYLPLANDINKE